MQEIMNLDIEHVIFVLHFSNMFFQIRLRPKSFNMMSNVFIGNTHCKETLYYGLFHKPLREKYDY